MLDNKETRLLLNSRWKSLPEYLQVDNQVVGKHWVQCAYTMGPSYCSFGCSHCYLPKSANRVPIIPLTEMKRQIDANRKMIGQGGRIQITGGDVVDAYLRENKQDELVEVIRYTVDAGLVPMLMTHGQGLLDNPDFLLDLVTRGGLRKLSCHIDITQVGRPGFPIKDLSEEKQLNPVRDQLIDLVLDIRKKTGCNLTAAHTITVSSKNIHSIDQILNWLMDKPKNMDVTRTISFQVEAQVGRTLNQANKVTPEQVWQNICQAVGKDLPGNQLLYGHPDCNSTAFLLVRSRDRKIISLCEDDSINQNFWNTLITQFGSLNVFTVNVFQNYLLRIVSVLINPRFLLQLLKFSVHLFRKNGLNLSMLGSLITGKAKGFNIVMHNFIDEQEVIEQKCHTTKDRLQACSFRGAVEIDGEWKAVPMCEVNAINRPKIYDKLKVNTA